MEQRILATTAHPEGCLSIASPASYSQSKHAVILTGISRGGSRTCLSDVTVYETLNEIAPENSDLCFTAERRLRDSCMVCRPLVRMHDVVVAAPAYIARRGPPATPAALTEHDILLATDAPNRYWEFRDFNGAHRVPLNPILTTQSLLAVKSAAVTGLDMRIANVLVERELAEGIACCSATRFPARQQRAHGLDALLRSAVYHSGRPVFYRFRCRPVS